MRKANFFFVVLLAVLAAGCSGGSTPPPPQLSVSCFPVQVEVLKTSQCSVSPATAGTWSVSLGPGTINSSGLYTAPATTSGGTSATVQFVAGSGGSATFTLAILAASSPGDILFTRFTPNCGAGTCMDVFAMLEDGSGVHPLTSDLLQDGEGAWNFGKTLIAFASNRDGKVRVYTMNPDGSNQRVVSSEELVRASSPGFFPDGRIAFVWQTATETGIAVMNSDGSGMVRLFSDSNRTNLPGRPRVSPDGTQILFARLNSAGILQIYIMPANGSAPPSILSPNPSNDGDPAWRPDGSRIAFTSTRNGTYAIWEMKVDGSGASQVTFPPAGFNDVEPVWSPSGDKIAFTRNNGLSLYDIYVVSAGVNSPEKKTSQGLNFNPDWR